MGEGTLIVNLKNNGSAACALQGFPGVDLKGKPDRSNVQLPAHRRAPSPVTADPGWQGRWSMDRTGTGLEGERHHGNTPDRFGAGVGGRAPAAARGREAADPRP
ncbi:DUF4232 domain-containing protein [Streptomyces sp. 5-6(2022)]|uniref:DUF4232 domain-containing protein n=1 Tax=Streptomyces sp. 5-6(2022) TaxID=2936510 RepID=UPI0023B9FB6A|nr:DUF4232 domain-containing protein [Streptomyces sp. 5-6(2022)]